MKRLAMQNLPRSLATTAFLTPLLAALSFSSAALAQAPEPSAADKATARALLDEGDALLKKGNVQAAHDKYKAADAIMGVPTTGLSLADAQVKLKLLVEAADTYARVQRFPVNSGEPKAFTQAREQAERRLAEVTERIPSATVKLAQGEPSDAMKLTLDGVEVSAATRFLPRKLNPGKHEAVIDSGNFRGAQSFELAEHESRTVTIALNPTGKPTLGGSGATTSADPNAGGNTTTGGAVGNDASGNANPPPHEEPKPSAEHPIHPGVWVGVGVTGAATLVGVLAGVAALGAKKDLTAQCPGGLCVTVEAQNTYDRAVGAANFSTASFVLGAAAGGATALVYFLTDAPATPSTGRVTPVLGPGYLGVGGSF